MDAAREYIIGLGRHYKGHSAIVRLQLAAEVFPSYSRLAYEGALVAAQQTQDVAVYEKVCDKIGAAKDTTWIANTQKEVQSRRVELERELSVQVNHSIRDGIRVS